MTEQLTNDQTIELLEQALEVYRYEDAETTNPEDMGAEIVDSWLPIYTHDIRQEWVAANCPEPNDIGSFRDAENMHHAMQMGLWELAHDMLMHVLGGADNCGEAADNIAEELSVITNPQKRVERILAS